jgi:hypothetical protein
MLQALPPSRYSPGSTFAIRIAGLPIESLIPLRFEQTMQLIQQLLVLEDQLRLQAEVLSDALYQVIGGVEQKQVRWKLMALRRAIHQIQLPRAKELSDDVWSALSDALAPQVKYWVEQMECWQALFSDGQSLLPEEWDEKRQALRRIAQSEVFQQGLVMGSKDLYADFIKWSATEGTERPSCDRQTELGLFMYLSRIATKTSPFSTFMSSGRGYWVNDSSTFICSPRWNRLSTTELNWTIVHRIAYELARWPEIRSTLTLRVSSSALEDGAHIRLLGWQQGEVVMKLENSPTLRHILQVVGTTPLPSYATIVHLLAGSDPEGNAPEVARFLDKLIGIGLLELDFGIPDQSLDYLGQLLLYLKPLRSQRVLEISQKLQSLHCLIQQYSAAHKPARRSELSAGIYALLEEIYQQFALKERGIELPAKNAFYENVVAEGIKATCSLTTWHTVLADLGRLQELGSLYDVALPARLAAKAFFVDHYGRGARVSLLHFYETFCKEIKQPGGWRPAYAISGAHLKELFENPYATPPGTLTEVQQVHQLYRDFRRQFMAWPLEAAGVHRLDLNLLQQFIAHFPSFITHHSRSLSFYTQMLMREGGPELVINGIGAGAGRTEGRLQFLERQLNHSQTNAPMRCEQGEQEPLLVDIAAVFGSNANLHTPQTPYELTYPGSVSARPPEEQIPLNDLDVIHDPSTHRLLLVSRRLQRELHPTNLGLLADFLRPSMERFLQRIFGSKAILPFLYLQVNGVESANETQPLSVYPRIYLGTLVVARATWLVGAQHLPKRERTSSPFAYMLKVQRWVRACGLPQQCFIRIPVGFWRSFAKIERSSAFVKDRKPLFIDFGNYFSIMLFEQLVYHAERMEKEEERMLLIQEALPAQGDLVVSDGEGHYVNELVIELTRIGASG